MVQSQDIINNDRKFKEKNRPLYREVAISYVNLDEYKENQIGYFTAFTSTSTDGEKTFSRLD